MAHAIKFREDGYEALVLRTVEDVLAYIRVAETETIDVFTALIDLLVLDGQKIYAQTTGLDIAQIRRLAAIVGAFPEIREIAVDVVGGSTSKLEEIASHLRKNGVRVMIEAVA